MGHEIEKSAKELEEENDLMMARAAIKVAVVSFHKMEQQEIPEELKIYWENLDTKQWKQHLKLFASELKNYKQSKVKEMLFDLDAYVKDCKKLVPNFKRSKEEILLMIAIGQIEVKKFVETLSQLPSNREKLDRKIQKQIKMLDWQDVQDLKKLDDLSEQLQKPKIKKKEVEEIEQEIGKVETNIRERKTKREELAIKLVEWKARGNIDIASGDGKFRLDA